MKTKDNPSLEQLCRQIEQVCDKITGFTYRVEDERLERNPAPGRRPRIKKAELWGLVKEGKSQQAIAESLGTSQSSISRLLTKESLRDVWQERRQERGGYHKIDLNRLEELFKEGKNSKEIATALGISSPYVFNLVRRRELQEIWREFRIRAGNYHHPYSAQKTPLPKVSHASVKTERATLGSPDEQIQKLLYAGLAENPATLNELSEKTGFKQKKVLNLCKEYGISLPEGFQQEYERRSRMSTSRRERLESLVVVDRTLKEIGNVFGVTSERARQMLKRAGLDKERKARRNEIKEQARNFQQELQSERQSFVDSLRQLEEIIAPTSPWVEVKVWQYRNLHPGNQGRQLPDEPLKKLFEAYAVALLEGKKLSVYELGKKSGISVTQVGRILREAGLDRMYRNIEGKATTPQWKKEALLRGFELSPLSVRDIAYFLELPYFVVGYNLSQSGQKSVQREPLTKGVGKNRLYYRHASQIYEAQDLGFSPEETSELLNLPLKRVTYVQYHRHEFAPVLIKALQVMFPEEKINTPYRWKKERR